MLWQAEVCRDTEAIKKDTLSFIYNIPLEEQKENISRIIQMKVSVINNNKKEWEWIPGDEAWRSKDMSNPTHMTASSHKI